MATKLVQITRGRLNMANFGESRYGVQSPTTVELLHEHEDFRGRAEFFFVEEKEIDRIVGVMASENPGKDIKVYDLVQVSTCPAAPLITKKVTKDGVLPA